MRSLPRGARRVAVGILAAAGLTGVIAGAPAGSEHNTARAAANFTITARDFFWSPDSVTIQVGDSVTWTNAQGFHNVLLGDSRLNQPGFPEDASWNPPPTRTFTEPGSFTFVCEVHPGMTGTVNVQGGEPTPTPTPTATPTPAVPPPGSAPPDTTAPALSAVTVSGAGTGVRIGLTVSEPATVNARFVGGDDIALLRSQVEQGTWTLERSLAGGTYTYELWAVDAMGNRSASEIGEVRIGG
jgi:plastocyanin